MMQDLGILLHCLNTLTERVILLFNSIELWGTSFLRMKTRSSSEKMSPKSGVYHVTSGLTKKFGVGRVFNTLLDETTILGLAMGAGHAGFYPFQKSSTSRTLSTQLTNFAAKPHPYSSSLKVNIIIQWWFGLHHLPTKKDLAAISTMIMVSLHYAKFRIAHRVPRPW